MKNSMYTFNIKKPSEDEEQPWTDQDSKMVALTTLGFIGGMIVAPFIVWAAWNVSMPVIFGLPMIGYFQSLGLYLVSRLLIK